jgi:lysyl endopeptidase
MRTLKHLAWVPSLCALVFCVAPVHALETLILPAVDVRAALAQDDKAAPTRWQFAVPQVANIRTDTHGLWKTLADGRRQWSMRIRSPLATSLNFHFAELQLPPDAELVLQSAQDRQLVEAGDTGIRGERWSRVLRGDSVDLTLTTPPGPPVKLHLQTVNHGFRGFGAKDAYTKSGSCNIDVVCEVADEWRDETRSVARYTVNGAFLCSGQMVNNTAQDFRPLFLTASHCVQTPLEAATMVFYWNYETSTCGGTPDGSLEQSTAGARFLAGSLLATNFGPDFTLVELSETPPEDFQVYWAGWDNRDIAFEDVTTIHHPAGDEKRISFFAGATEITAYLGEPGEPDLLGQADTHLKIADWDLGTTEGGSSGSGLWTADRHVVGQLSGGYASCSSQTADWYGRMHTNWFGFPGALTSVASHLDPLDSGAEFLDGADPQAVVEADPAEDESAQPTTRSATRAGSVPLLVLLVLLGLGRRHSLRR